MEIRVELSSPFVLKSSFLRMNTKLYLKTLFLSLLFATCGKEKSLHIPQSNSFKAMVKARTDEFANEISNANYQKVMTEGEFFLKQHQDSLLKDSIGWAMLHHRLGVAYSKSGSQNDSNYRKFNGHFAIAEKLRRLNNSQSAALANTYLNWGKGLASYQNYQLAIPLLKKAHEYYTTSDDTLRLISNIRELISANYQVGDINIANDQFYWVQKIYHKITNPNPSIQKEFAGILNFVGYTEANNNSNYTLAIEKFKESISIYEKVEGSQFDIIEGKMQLAHAYKRTGKHETALQIYKNLLADYKNLTPIDTPAIIRLKGIYLSDSYLDLNNLTLAKNNCTEAIPILIKNNDKISLSITYHTLGKIYSKEKKYRLALESFQKAIIAIAPTFQNEDILSNPNDNDLSFCNIKYDLKDNLISKAQTLQIYATQTKSVTYLDVAWQTYQALNTLQSLIRADVLTEQSKMRVGENSTWVADALALAKQLQAKNPSKNYLEEAYAMAQQVKAQVINEHLQGEKGKILANISEAEQEKERLLLAEMSQLRKQLLDNPNDGALMQRALNAEQKYYDYEEDLAKKYPIFAKAKFDYKALSINEIQANLSNDMAVLDYLPTADSLHIFCINKNQLAWKTVAITPKDKSNVDSLQLILNQAISKIETPESKQFLNCAHAAYRCLIAPVAQDLKGIKRLRVVAAGWVYRVGFESLLTTPYEGNWSDKKVPYLIRDCAVSYLFSIKQLPYVKPPSKGAVSVGSFGISYSDGVSFQTSRSNDSCLHELGGTRGGGKLNYAVQEAKAVQSLWGIGDCILDKNATKNEFIKRCKSNNYSILHLAMHGIPECEDPNNIQLVFSKDSASQDNLMRMSEIAGLRMNSDLAVLSACHSGDGHLENYEGMMSLGRAFAMAGCESLVTSNSYVIDESSPILFDAFYKSLKDNNLAKDLALQKSICDYLDNKSDVFRIPYRWANFHLWGNVDTLQGNSPNFFSRYWKWLLMAGFVLFGLAFLRKRNT